MYDNLTHSPLICYGFGFLALHSPLLIQGIRSDLASPCSSPKQARLWFHLSRSDFRTTEALAPGTVAAPAVQADNVAAMTTVMEADTTAAVSEEPVSQAVVQHAAEVKAADAPVASSETPVATEAPAR